MQTLSLFLGSKKVDEWYNKYHKKNWLPFFDRLKDVAPLIIFSGEIGCGKTALAQSIATPLAKELDTKISVFESPSNVRGSGMVGELSNRISEMFTSAKSKLGKDKAGILIIDEADDIATSRAQNQAHHEDRAGLNILIKQIDRISKEDYKLAVILITNRVTVIDPAIRRRASLNLTFERPNGEVVNKLFKHIFNGIELKKEDLANLTQIVKSKDIPYSFSDLVDRAGKQALSYAIHKDVPFSVKIYKEALQSIEPSPLIKETSISNMNQNGRN